MLLAFIDLKCMDLKTVGTDKMWTIEDSRCLSIKGLIVEQMAGSLYAFADSKVSPLSILQKVV